MFKYYLYFILSILLFFSCSNSSLPEEDEHPIAPLSEEGITMEPQSHDDGVEITLTDNYQQPVPEETTDTVDSFSDIEVPEDFNFSVFQPYSFEIHVMKYDGETNPQPYPLKYELIHGSPENPGSLFIAGTVRIDTGIISYIEGTQIACGESHIGLKLCKNRELMDQYPEIAHLYDGPDLPEDFTIWVEKDRLENETLTILFH